MQSKLLLPALVFLSFSIQCNNDNKSGDTNAKRKMPVATAIHMSSLLITSERTAPIRFSTKHSNQQDLSKR